MIIQGRRNGYSRYSDRCTEYKTNFVGLGGFFLLRRSYKESRRVFKLSFLFRCFMRIDLWCRRVTRLLAVLTKAPFGKYEHSQNQKGDGISPFGINYQHARGCGMWVWGCVTPLRASWSRTIINPTRHIFCYFGNKVSPWGNSICNWFFDWKVVRVLSKHFVHSLKNVSELVFEAFQQGKYPKFSSRPSIMNFFIGPELETYFQQPSSQLKKYH